MVDNINLLGTFVDLQLFNQSQGSHIVPVDPDCSLVLANILLVANIGRELSDPFAHFPRSHRSSFR
jgi:hypothetical protein